MLLLVVRLVVIVRFFGLVAQGSQDRQNDNSHYGRDNALKSAKQPGICAMLGGTKAGRGRINAGCHEVARFDRRSQTRHHGNDSVPIFLEIGRYGIAVQVR